MNIEEIEKLDRISRVLETRAAEMGVFGFRVKNEVLDLEDSMDQEGPLTWALFMQASIISRMAGLPRCPFECVIDPETVFGCKGVITDDCNGAGPYGFTLWVANLVLDSALEHAVVVGLKDLGCSREEWAQLPAELRVLSVEAYLDELGANWVGEHLEYGTTAEKVLGWPVLLDFQTYDESMSANQSARQSENMKVNGLAPFTPKQ